MPTDQILSLAVQATLSLGGYLLYRFATRDRHPMTIQDAAAVIFGKSPGGIRAAAIFLEQRRRVRNTHIAGRIAMWAVIAWAVLVPGRNLLEMEADNNQLLLASTFIYISVGLIVTLKGLIAGRWYLQPRLVLILRRFGRRTRRYAVIPDNVAEACRGLAVPITIQDSSFLGALPVGLNLVRQWMGIPFTLSMLLPMRAASAIGIPAALSVWVVSWAAVAVYGNRLLVRLGVFQAGVSDYARVLDRLIRDVRRRRWLYAGTRSMRFPDEVWRDAIEIAIREVDAVVIDVSDVSEAVAWEIATVERLVPPERVLIIWYDERTEAERIGALQAQHAAELFGDRPVEDPFPAHIRQALSGLVTPEWFGRCCFLPYERKRGRAGAVAFAAEATTVLVRFFAHKEVEIEAAHPSVLQPGISAKNLGH